MADLLGSDSPFPGFFNTLDRGPGWQRERLKDAVQANRFVDACFSKTLWGGNYLYTEWTNTVLAAFNDEASFRQVRDALAYIDNWFAKSSVDTKAGTGDAFWLKVAKQYESETGGTWRPFIFVLGADFVLDAMAKQDTTGSYTRWNEVLAAITPNDGSARFLNKCFQNANLIQQYMLELQSHGLAMLDALNSSIVNPSSVQAESIQMSSPSRSDRRWFIETLDNPVVTDPDTGKTSIDATAQLAFNDWVSGLFGYTAGQHPSLEHFVCNATQILAQVWQLAFDEAMNTGLYTKYTNVHAEVIGFSASTSKATGIGHVKQWNPSGPTLQATGKSVIQLAGSQDAPKLTVDADAMAGAGWTVDNGWPALKWDETYGAPCAGDFDFNYVLDPATTTGAVGARLNGVVTVKKASGLTTLLNLEWTWPTTSVAEAASGDVVFRRKAAKGEVTVPVGTVVRTSDGVAFKTTYAAILSDGTTESTSTQVVALKAGPAGNVAAGTIIAFVEQPPGIDSVTNLDATSGGANYEADLVTIAVTADTDPVPNPPTNQDDCPPVSQGGCVAKYINGWPGMILVAAGCLGLIYALGKKGKDAFKNATEKASKAWERLTDRTRQEDFRGQQEVDPGPFESGRQSVTPKSIADVANYVTDREALEEEESAKRDDDAENDGEPLDPRKAE